MAYTSSLLSCKLHELDKATIAVFKKGRLTCRFQRAVSVFRERRRLDTAAPLNRPQPTFDSADCYRRDGRGEAGGGGGRPESSRLCHSSRKLFSFAQNLQCFACSHVFVSSDGTEVTASSLLNFGSLWCQEPLNVDGCHGNVDVDHIEGRTERMALMVGASSKRRGRC